MFKCIRACRQFFLYRIGDLGKGIRCDEWFIDQCLSGKKPGSPAPDLGKFIEQYFHYSIAGGNGTSAHCLKARENDPLLEKQAIIKKTCSLGVKCGGS